MLASFAGIFRPRHAPADAHETDAPVPARTDEPSLSGAWSKTSPSDAGRVICNEPVMRI